MERLLAANPVLEHFRRFLLDAFFPIYCLGCHAEGQYLCNSCFERIPERDSQECPVCRMPYSPNGAVCKKCRRSTSLDGIFIATSYQNKLVDTLIHTFKYRFIQSLKIPLAALLERSLAHNTLSLPDGIVPVPLHPRRLRFRGFNQAELLAEELLRTLAPGLSLPLEREVLSRIRFTKPQMKTRSAEERRQNLSQVFAVSPEKMWAVAGKNIWIVDDVATTGSTLEECARALKVAGAKSVWGLVLAR